MWGGHGGGGDDGAGLRQRLAAGWLAAEWPAWLATATLAELVLVGGGAALAGAWLWQQFLYIL